MSETYDVVVIGAGPGGYVAAIKAGQLGLKVACIEKRKHLGGTCLNVGCIPSKALLQSSENWYGLHHSGALHGIEAKSVKHNFSAMMDRKTQIVDQFRMGIKGLFRKNKVKHYSGLGVLKSATEISVVDPESGKETETITAKNIILATGSDSVSLPFLPVDEKQIVTSTGALSLEKVPKKMIVVGGGVIGVEMASVYCRLGADVTVVEMLDMICPGMDGAVRKGLLKILKDQGIKFELSAKVKEAKVGKKDVTLTVENSTGEDQNLQADVVLVAVGRKAYTEGLGLENVGLETNKMGQVAVDDMFRTSVPNIYAIGDLIEGPMLAHKASEEGVAVVENIAGHNAHVEYIAIPSVVYTSPEAASVGLTEEDAKERNLEVSIGQFPFKACSRALCIGESDGFVKIVAHKPTGRLLGMHILGHMAGELIATGALALETRAPLNKIANFPAAHPTLAEAVKEAAMAASSGKAIHM